MATRHAKRALLAVFLGFCSLFFVADRSYAGDNPVNFQVGANERDLVRLVSGGPRGFGTKPHGLPVGAPIQVFHTPWQEFGWNPAETFKVGLWVINEHGVPKERPPGACAWSVMDHTIAIVFEEDGKTPRIVAEMLPEKEGNWTVRSPGDPEFERYTTAMREGKLIPGKRGTVSRFTRVGNVYGLGDHCCTNEANRLVVNPRGPGVTARGLNRIGYELDRLGFSSAVRDVWEVFGGLTKSAWARVAPDPNGALGLNLTRMLRVGNAQIPYTPSVGGVMMGVSFALHAEKQGVVPTLVSAGAGVVVWEVGTRATIRAAGMAFGEAGVRVATKWIPIVGEVLLVADISLTLANRLAGPGQEIGWFDLLDYYTGKLDAPTFVAGPAPPPDQNAYYD